MEARFPAKNLLFVVVALVLAYGIYSTAGVALDTKIPVVAVTSGSMEPAFYRGDMIVVKGKEFESIQEGDVVVFSADCMPVPIIHRVIERDSNSLETRGDKNTNQVSFCKDSDGSCRPAGNSCGPGEEFINVEKNITEEQVLGTAWVVIPDLGHLKLIPTCFYMRMLYGQAASFSYVC